MSITSIRGRTHEDRLPAAPSHLDRLLDRAGQPDRLERHVGTSFAGHVPDGGHRVGLKRVHSGCRPQVPGEIELGSVHVNGDDLARTG
ncbi:MAG TPA: hypothetical protein VF711_12265, partial [Acidimicrobiales bacterium]